MEQKFKALNKNHKAMIRRKGLVPENYRLLKELNYALFLVDIRSKEIKIIDKRN